MSQLPPLPANAKPRGGRVFESAWFWILAIGLAFAVPLALSLRRPQLKAPPVLGQMKDFRLVDQDGQGFDSQMRLGGIVSLFTFVDTSCGEPCKDTMERLYRLQRSLKGAGPTVRMMSLSVAQPAPDRPEALKHLGRSLNASFHSWTFLTGEPAEVKGLLAQLLAQAPEAYRAAAPASLAQSGLVVLVDQRGQIRGVHELRQPETIAEAVKETAFLINTRPPTP